LSRSPALDALAHTKKAKLGRDWEHGLGERIARELARRYSTGKNDRYGAWRRCSFLDGKCIGVGHERWVVEDKMALSLANMLAGLSARQSVDSAATTA
jgi:hypothetical protein